MVFADATLQNYALPTLFARSRIPFGVEYGSDVDKVRKIVIETLSKMKTQQDYCNFRLEQHSFLSLVNYLILFYTSNQTHP